MREGRPGRYHAPVRLVAFALAGIVGCAALVGPGPARADAARDCGAEPYRERGTAVACPRRGFVALLPGRGWTVRDAVPGAPRVRLDARLAPYFHVAVSAAESTPSGGAPPAPAAVLADLYARARAGSASRGVVLGPPTYGESRPNRPTVAYETEGLTVNGVPHRSAHVWTYGDRPGGERLVYHASWTGPADVYDPDLPATLEAMAAGFVLLDAAGEAIDR